MKKIVRLTETDLVRLVKKVISEQSNPNSKYTKGQTLKAKRSIDNKIYTIRILDILPDGGHVVAYVMGPGEYQGKPLDGRVSLELNANEDGKLSGNMQMGEFIIMK